MRAVQNVAQVSDHWWWRPGWRIGRRFYACHITFENAPKVRSLAATYQERLKGLDGLDLIPQPWLHLTMQGIGFTDEISNNEIESITTAISSRLAKMTRPVVTFGRPSVQTEAIFLPATPADGIKDVRKKTQQAIQEILGPDRSPDTDIDKALHSYRPHMSIAYVNKTGSAASYVEALSEALPDPVRQEIRTVSILTFHRDNRMYEWTNSIPIKIGQ